MPREQIFATERHRIKKCWKKMRAFKQKLGNIRIYAQMRVENGSEKKPVI